MSRAINRNVDILFEAWNVIDGRWGDEWFDRYFAEDYVRHADEGQYTRSGYREVIRELHTAFPDLDATLSEIVADGDRVAYRWVSTGIHEGVYMGVPATHRRVTATGLTISRFADGKIVEEWASWNKVSVLHRLGIIPIGLG